MSSRKDIKQMKLLALALSAIPLCAKCGVWNYTPYEYEAWMLQEMRAECDRGILHFGYSGNFLTLTNEPSAFYSEVPVSGYEPIQGVRNCPPHRRPYPETEMPLTLREDGIYDLGHEDIGIVQVEAAHHMRPTLYVGESLTEVRSSDYDGFEQSTLMIPEERGRWRSDIPVATRYLRFSTKIQSVRFFSQVNWKAKPVVRFSSPDKRLEGVWNAGAETLRLCCRTFYVDGLKRDRLPWAADLIVGILANADSFRDPEPIKRTLAALGSCDPVRGGSINGIASYSSWWVIGHDLLQRNFDARDYLKLHYPRIVARMGEIETHCDTRGFLAHDLGWNFMDWTDNAGGILKSEITLQCIYYWALTSAAHLALLSDDAEHVRVWAERAERLREKVLSVGMDETRHARILAIVSGLVDGEDAARFAREIGDDTLPPTVTPYMATLEVMALARGGQMDAAWRRFESVWGAMYDAGLRTFCEGWDPTKNGDKHYVFYGRPYANSQCHLWSSGVVHLLSSVLK